MHTSSIIALLVASAFALVLAQPACPPPTPIGEFSVKYKESNNVFQYSNTMIYSGSTLQQRLSYHVTGLTGYGEGGIYIINGSTSDPSKYGKYWVIKSDQDGNYLECLWGYITGAVTPVEVNPPLIDYNHWTTCKYIAPEKIDGEQVYHYSMTNPTLELAMEYYINTQTLDPVRYIVTYVGSRYNQTDVKDFGKFDYSTPDPSSFWLPPNTPPCVYSPG